MWSSRAIQPPCWCVGSKAPGPITEVAGRVVEEPQAGHLLHTYKRRTIPLLEGERQDKASTNPRHGRERRAVGNAFDFRWSVVSLVQGRLFSAEVSLFFTLILSFYFRLFHAPSMSVTLCSADSHWSSYRERLCEVIVTSLRPLDHFDIEPLPSVYLAAKKGYTLRTCGCVARLDHSSAFRKNRG